jgi:benzoyl-CoA reductase subunit D
MITAGIDCGAQYTKSVIQKDSRIIGKGMVPSGFDLIRAVDDSLAGALRQAQITRRDIERICATGAGRNAVPMADESINDIKAMSQGAFFFFPNARTVADVGAEEARAAKLDGKGHSVDFAINEKCAAGAGAFIEAMARALDVSIEEMGLLCLRSEKQIPINAQCAIFAESEVVGLIHSNAARPDISRAVHDAIAGRIVSMIRKVGIHEDVALIGGLARNPGFTSCLARQLKVNRVYTPPDPEFGAATGAAAFTAETRR